MLFILAIALLIFGPKRLPEFGRTIGKALGEFRRATTDLKRSIDVEMTAPKPALSKPAAPAAPAAAAPVARERAPEEAGRDPGDVASEEGAAKAPAEEESKDAPTG